MRAPSTPRAVTLLLRAVRALANEAGMHVNWIVGTVGADHTLKIDLDPTQRVMYGAGDNIAIWKNTPYRGRVGK